MEHCDDALERVFQRLSGKMGSTTSRLNPKVVGFCDPKYEKVKKHLENMLINGSDENFQLCVYVEGKCVIDLYGILDENSSYNANKTQVNLFPER